MVLPQFIFYLSTVSRCWAIISHLTEDRYLEQILNYRSMFNPKYESILTCFRVIQRSIIGINPCLSSRIYLWRSFLVYTINKLMFIAIEQLTFIYRSVRITLISPCVPFHVMSWTLKYNKQYQPFHIVQGTLARRNGVAQGGSRGMLLL